MSHFPYGSCPRLNFGNDTFSQSFSIHIELPSVPQQLNMLSQMMQSLTSIWKNRMMVCLPVSGAAGPADA
jgi:hypothetical protein